MSGPAVAPAPVHVQGLRVYWEDTDAGGIVFYANYLKFFERARTEWLRARGHQQERLRVEQGLVFVVARTEVSYRAPARLDDWLWVDVRVVEAGRASLVIDQRAWRDAPASPDGSTGPPVVLAEGRIRIGCVDAATLRPQRMPAAVLAAIA